MRSLIICKCKNTSSWRSETISRKESKRSMRLIGFCCSNKYPSSLLVCVSSCWWEYDIYLVLLLFGDMNICVVEAFETGFSKTTPCRSGFWNGDILTIFCNTLYVVSSCKSISYVATHRSRFLKTQQYLVPGVKHRALPASISLAYFMQVDGARLCPLL